uniref:DIX domain-containing protein n=1 Tax=Euplotes crassus TaxID=5936 RepID=A0A7S3KCJ8_EUPCR
MNAFPVYKKLDDIRLPDIKEAFPLPGEYHFRFQHFYKHDMLVWLDLNNERAQLPNIEGQITIKVLRLSWRDSLQSNPEPEPKASVPVNKRKSEPEEYKDIDDLIGGSSGNKEEPSLQNRHSHAHNIKPPTDETDPFAGIDFTQF